MSSAAWKDHLQMTKGILRVSRNEFVCGDCGTEKMSEDEIVAHSVVHHFQPLHYVRYPDERECIKMLQFPEVKRDWLVSLELEELLRLEI